VSTKIRRRKGGKIVVNIRHPKIMEALDKSTQGPWEQSKVVVLPTECANCLLGDDPVVGPEEVQAILDARALDGRAFECHLATIAGVGRCCNRFFWEGRSLVVRIALAKGWWEYRNLNGDLVYCLPDPAEAKKG